MPPPTTATLPESGSGGSIDPFGLLDGDCAGGLYRSRYRIDRLVAEGGFGAVFFAEDLVLARPVALKVSRHPSPATPDDPFLAEARVLAGIDHPNVLPVYDYGRTAHDRSVVVSKWVAGTDLARRLRASALPTPEAVRVVLCVAEGLDAAHERNLVHRDVKPANVLLEGDGRVYVADFGLARSPDHRIVGFAGTPSYCSPEQARSAPRLDARSDIFSLGVVFYELLTGNRPFVAPTTEGVLGAVMAAEYPPMPGGTPAPLVALCERMLQLDPGKRPSSARAVATALRSFLDASQPRTEPPSEAASVGGAVPIGISLRVESGPDAGRVYPVASRRVLIGRGRDCDVRLTDARVSRAQASVEWDPLGRCWSIRDAGGPTPILVGGEQIHGAAVLPIGLTVQVGRTCFRLEAQSIDWDRLIAQLPDDGLRAIARRLRDRHDFGAIAAEFNLSDPALQRKSQLIDQFARQLGRPSHG